MEKTTGLSRRAKYRTAIAAAILATMAVLAPFSYDSCGYFSWIILLSLTVVVVCLSQVLVAFVWRDCFRATGHLQSGDATKAQTLLEKFLHDVREKPWVRVVSWLSLQTDTRDPEAYALFMLGDIALRAGNKEEALSRFEAAVRRDRLFAAPHYVIGWMGVNDAPADVTLQWLDNARVLGLTRALGTKRTKWARKPLAAATVSTGAGRGTSVEMLNDDRTPMEFVVQCLERIFRMDDHAATRTMLAIHRNGSAPIGLFTPTEAKEMIDRVHAMARAEGHPLQCRIWRDAGAPQ